MHVKCDSAMEKRAKLKGNCVRRAYNISPAALFLRVSVYLRTLKTFVVSRLSIPECAWACTTDAHFGLQPEAG